MTGSVYTATGGTKGDVTLNPDGHSFTYTPRAGEIGTDTITVSVTDATNAHFTDVRTDQRLSFGRLA